MNYSNYRFTLDIQSNLSQVSLPVKLNDTGRQLLIGLTDGGNPYTISEGSMAKFTYKKTEPNSEGIYEAGIYDCVLEDNYNTIRFDLISAITNVAGVVDCEIRLYGPNGRLLTSPRFIMVVNERVIYDDDIPLDEQQISAIDAIILSEASRVEEESKRVSAEEARAEAEALRESTFQSAESSRASAFQTAESERESSVQSAVDNANSAAEYAIGSTPYIGENGNWWINEEDTGKPSRGETGKTGAKIVDTQWLGKNTVGDYVYRQTFDDGSTSTFSVPKGEKGEKGDPGEDAVIDYNLIYPVHSLFVDDESTPPTNRGIPGTWEAIPEGHTIIGAGSTYPANSTGGSADAVIVNHTHSKIEALEASSWKTIVSLGQNWGGTTKLPYVIAANVEGNASTGAIRTSTPDGGVDGAGKNMMPYIAKYAWIRIA